MKNKKLWISLSIAGVLLLVAAVVVWFSCSGSSGWEWEDDEDDDDDSSVSSDDDDDDSMQSAIDQMIATELDIPVLLAKEPMQCAADGLGNVIENYELLENLGRTGFLKSI